MNSRVHVKYLWNILLNIRTAHLLFTYINKHHISNMNHENTFICYGNLPNFCNKATTPPSINQVHISSFYNYGF